jgi:hypothetical protein
MKRIDWNIMGPFLLLAIGRVMFDLLFTMNIQKDAVELYHSNAEELHTAVQYTIAFSAAGVIGIILMLSSFVSKHRVIEGTIGLLLFIGSAVMYYNHELADIVLYAEEVTLLFVTVILASVILTQKHIAYLAIVFVIDGAYVLWHNEPETIYFLEVNIALSAAIAIAMFYQLKGIGHYIDQRDGISTWYEMETKWIEEDKLKSKF